jgi:DNA-binding NtrC family response regulator
MIKNEQPPCAIQLLVDQIFAKSPFQLKCLIGDIEKEIILRAVLEKRGNLKAAARQLGIKYTTLHEKTQRYEIQIRKIVSYGPSE